MKEQDGQRGAGGQTKERRGENERAIGERKRGNSRKDRWEKARRSREGLRQGRGDSSGESGRAVKVGMAGRRKRREEGRAEEGRRATRARCKGARSANAFNFTASSTTNAFNLGMPVTLSTARPAAAAKKHGQAAVLVKEPRQ